MQKNLIAVLVAVASAAVVVTAGHGLTAQISLCDLPWMDGSKYCPHPLDSNPIPTPVIPEAVPSAQPEPQQMEAPTPSEQTGEPPAQEEEQMKEDGYAPTSLVEQDTPIDFVPGALAQATCGCLCLDTDLETLKRTAGRSTNPFFLSPRDAPGTDCKNFNDLKCVGWHTESRAYKNGKLDSCNLVVKY